MPASHGESPEHLRLKQLALIWAQAAGYPVAASEVGVPEYQVRVDVAAYRPARQVEERWDESKQRPRKVSIAKLGLTAIFECKVSRPDYLRDAACLRKTRERLEVLSARKARYEHALKLHYPNVANGDSLFPEYQTFEFERPGDEVYQRIVREIRRLSGRLHSQTKFDRLTQWGAANACFLVTEADLFKSHEVPAGWGVLLRRGDALEVHARPELRPVTEAQRLLLLHRIALAATRAVNAAHEITYPQLEDARRSITSPPGFPGSRLRRGNAHTVK